jgi:hypothetical protein
LDGARNFLPPFIAIDGPVREARFIHKPDGTPDGGVHDLFVITGRVDAMACGISQPDFGVALANHNVIFRIPTPVFGAGLVESIADNVIIHNAANPIKILAGVSGRPNRSGNDGTVTRFGWKAQNKSLLIFAGEAYNVEQGVTNELFPNERDETPGCVLNPLPEDSTNLTTDATYLPSGYSSDTVNFAMFARLSAPPVPAPATAVTSVGGLIFNQIGCNLCHTPTLKTGSTFRPTGQSNVTVNAFSDFLLHNMGTNLADNISQGAASGSEFRTAPLWGLGQRIFFLHDGRTQDLVDAIEEHRSQGSEANQVITTSTYSRKHRRRLCWLSCGLSEGSAADLCSHGSVGEGGGDAEGRDRDPRVPGIDHPLCHGAEGHGPSDALSDAGRRERFTQRLSKRLFRVRIPAAPGLDRRRQRTSALNHRILFADRIETARRTHGYAADRRAG